MTPLSSSSALRGPVERDREPARVRARALQLCRERRPQVVLMDIRLPDANGIELTAQIMQMLPATKVIIVSQYSELAYVERALAAGAYAYIGKDQLYRMLLATIKRALGRGAAAAPITGIHEPRATRHD